MNNMTINHRHLQSSSGTELLRSYHREEEAPLTARVPAEPPPPTLFKSIC